MSAQLPPDPILTTYQYWNWANVDEETRRQRALDNTYMMFPTVQNNPTTFSKLFLITDATLTKMANTSYVYSVFINLLSAINIWSGSNTFGSIDTNSITTNTITATTIALSGTQLDTPMTSTRTYPIIPMSLTSGTTNTYGTAGTIGHTLVRAVNCNARFFGNGNTYCFADQSLSIPVGIWYLVGETICSKTYGQANGNSFGITAPAQPVVALPATFFGGNFTIHFSTGAQNNNTLPFGGSGSTVGSVYVNNTGANQTVGLYHFQPGFGWENGGVGYLTATKIG